MSCLNQKWSKFQLLNITLELKKASILKKSFKNTSFDRSYEKDDKTFVVFEIDSVRERRPFLLSRDFAFVRPSGGQTEPFKVSLLNFNRFVLCNI